MMPEETTFEVLDATHWKVLQLDIEKLYKFGPITAGGDYWMKIYKLVTQHDPVMLRKIEGEV